LRLRVLQGVGEGRGAMVYDVRHARPFNLRNVVQNQPENVVLNEERVCPRFEHKVLHKGLWRVIVRLKLAENVDKNSSVEHRLAVDGRDKVGDLLEGERLQLLHDLGDALHLLALEREQ